MENLSKNYTGEELKSIATEFKRHGFAIVRNVITKNEINLIQSQWQGLRDPLAKGEKIDGIHRDNFYIHGKLPAEIGSVYKHPKILEIAKQLLGPDLAIYLNRLNVKDNQFRDLIHLHQDMPYFHGGNQKINFFIALQNININNGAMVFVSDSHHIGILDRETIDISKHPELELVVPSLNAGDLILADIHLWHSSVQNQLGTDRVLLQIIFQPSDDGSFYPPSIAAPELACGKWNTQSFSAWETIKPKVILEEVIEDNFHKPATIIQSSIHENTNNLIESEPESMTPTNLKVTSISRKLKHIFKTITPKPIRRIVKTICNNFKAEQTNNNELQSISTIILENNPIPARQLPNSFTPSTGPEQVWPLSEDQINWLSDLEPVLQFLNRNNKRKIILALRNLPSQNILNYIRTQGFELKGFLHIGYAEQHIPPQKNCPVYLPKDLPLLQDINAIVVLATRDFSLAIRQCEQYLRQDVLFIPGSIEAIVPEPVRKTSLGEWATRSSILTYLQVSALRGHFAEFGTFWGRAFFNSYFELSQWLNGNFYAFDSFEGLSEPESLETRYTNGDFKKGAYGFNHISFQAIAEILNLPKERVFIIPGFFDKSLTPNKATELNIAPKSLSVCRIDCDLLSPTLEVLEFITPLLDDGALIYFDDWRLCRADPNIGERGAALKWLSSHPSLELIEFPSIHWQHQWFIFHRNKKLVSSPQKAFVETYQDLVIS